jgi:hypothetical protein
LFWSLYCLFFFDLRLLIITLVSVGHCIVCSSLIYGFWLSLWFALVIVLSVLLWFTASDYHFGLFWSLYCLFFFDLRASVYHFGLFWPLYCLFFFDLRLQIITLVCFGHCIVCSALIYRFWLLIWYLHTDLRKYLKCYWINICFLLCLCILRYLVLLLCPSRQCVYVTISKSVNTVTAITANDNSICYIYVTVLNVMSFE